MTAKLGDVLIALGFITPDQLAAGLARQAEEQMRIGEILIGMGVLSEDGLAKALQRQTGVGEWDRQSSPVHRRVIEMFPAELAIRHRVFPVAMRKNTVGITWCIATADPTDDVTRNDIGKALCTPAEPVIVLWLVSTPSEIDAALGEHYSDAVLEEPMIVIEDPVEVESAPGSPALLGRIRIARRTSSPGEDAER